MTDHLKERIDAILLADVEPLQNDEKLVGTRIHVPFNESHRNVGTFTFHRDGRCDAALSSGESWTDWWRLIDGILVSFPTEGLFGRSQELDWESIPDIAWEYCFEDRLTDRIVLSNDDGSLLSISENEPFDFARLDTNEKRYVSELRDRSARGRQKGSGAELAD